jgi:hypothetical protein
MLQLIHEVFATNAIDRKPAERGARSSPTTSPPGQVWPVTTTASGCSRADGAGVGCFLTIWWFVHTNHTPACSRHGPLVGLLPVHVRVSGTLHNTVKRKDFVRRDVARSLMRTLTDKRRLEADHRVARRWAGLYKPRSESPSRGGRTMTVQVVRCAGTSGRRGGPIGVVKLLRARGGCLGVIRIRAWKAAISPGELPNERRARNSRATQGTETSQYLEEKKSTETPLVAASERGLAQTGRDTVRG